MKRILLVLILSSSALGFAAHGYAKDSTILFRYKQTLVHPANDPADPDGEEGTGGPGSGEDSGSGDQDPEEPNGLRAIDLDGNDADPSTYRNVTVSPDSNLEFPNTGNFCVEAIVEGFTDQPDISVSVAGGGSTTLASTLENGVTLYHVSDLMPGQPADRWYLYGCGTAMYDDGGTKEISYTWADPDGRTFTLPTTLHVNPQPRPPLAIDLSGWETDIDLTSHANWTDRVLNLNIKGGVAPYTVTDVQASPFFEQSGSWLYGLASSLNSALNSSYYPDGVYFGLVTGTSEPEIVKTSIQNADDFARCAAEHDCTLLPPEPCAVSSFDAHQEYIGFTVKDSIGASVTVPLSEITTASNVQCSNAGYPHHWVWGMPTPPYEYAIDANIVSPGILGHAAFTSLSNAPIY